jgi:hypothetical protein
MVAKDKVDEFGGHTKVDPKEIGLVKRLDLYMLVCAPLSARLCLPLTSNSFGSPSYGSCTCEYKT